MKILIFTFTLLFSTALFPTSSQAEWMKVGQTKNGNTHYVDFERIRKHDGFVYWWELIDFKRPDKQGVTSHKSYLQGDCKLFRFQYLSISTHKEPMGGGTGKTSTYDDDQWNYPSPNSSMETKLKQVCSR